MRIGLFTDADVFAGTERHILDLAIALRAEGVEGRVICPASAPLAERALAAGLSVIPVDKSPAPVDWRAIRTIATLLDSGELNIIHAHNGRTLLWSTIAMRLAGAGRCVATQHFIDPSRADRKGFKGVASRVAHQWINRRVDHFIAISEAVHQAMLSRGEVSEWQLTVIPNGIVVDNHALPSPEQIAETRRALGIPIDSPFIVCAARLEKEKAVGTLVEAMKEVVTAHPTSICIIAGEGAEMPALEAFVRQYSLANTVRLIGFRSDVRSILAAADIFVLPSVAEPFGLALLEAMSLAKPVVATRAGGPLEIIDQGRTGLLVPPRDPRALAGAINRLIAEPQTRKQMGDAGLERLAQRFTAQKMARETKAVYERVLMNHHCKVADIRGFAPHPVTVKA